MVEDGGKKLTGEERKKKSGRFCKNINSVVIQLFLGFYMYVTFMDTHSPSYLILLPVSLLNVDIRHNHMPVNFPHVCNS